MLVGVHEAVMIAAVLLCVIAPSVRPRLRWACHIVVVAGVVLLGIVDGQLDWAMAVVVVLLFAVALVATAFAADLRRARLAEAGQRAAAERRAELLHGVRELPGRSLSDGARAAVATMLSLGFDGAGVAVVRGDRLHHLHVDGIPDPSPHVRVGEGMAGQAVLTGRTLVVGDYRDYPHRLEGHEHVRSALAAPIRDADGAVGSVMCSRRQPEVPTDAEVEIAEVLAAHLGAAISTDRQMRRQRELVRRMNRLDEMRRSFAARVFEELRDPLEVIQRACARLGDEDGPVRREEKVGLVEEMSTRTRELNDAIATLLDFSTFHRGRTAGAVHVRELVDVADAVGGERPFERTTEPVLVEVDPSFVARALDVADPSGAAPVRFDVGDTRVRVVLEEIVIDDDHPLTRAVVEQLVTAGGGELESVDPVSVLLDRVDLPEGPR